MTKYQGIPIHDIVIYKHPLLYIQLGVKVLIDLIVWLINFVVKNLIFMIGLVVLAGIIYKVQFLQPLKVFLFFAAYWVILGVASSIGLGTGLHTFVLYLGPHIAKVAMVATNCGNLPQMKPSRWDFDHFGPCQQTNQTIGFLGILLAVQIESFLWGFGTALGELPPYFVAKKAAQVNEELARMERDSDMKQAKTDEERKTLKQAPSQINEVTALRENPNKSFMDRAKIFLYDNLQKYGFITILIGASIPNPLFDLAGITCGHFRVPFRKFFTATFIGKAIIKVHIQMLFVIMVFRKKTVQTLLNVLQGINQGLAKTIESLIQKQRQALHHPSTSDQKTLLGNLWDLFIILMVGYFLLSIVTSEIQEKAVSSKDKQN